MAVLADQCVTPGCINLGESCGKNRPRRAECCTCRAGRLPAKAATRRRASRRRHVTGARAANKLVRRERVLCASEHHRGMRRLLGGSVGDGDTVSRTCPPDCPDSYTGHSRRDGAKVAYPLCLNPEHYVLESLDANRARGSHSL